MYVSYLWRREELDTNVGMESVGIPRFFPENSKKARL